VGYDLPLHGAGPGEVLLAAVRRPTEGSGPEVTAAEAVLELVGVWESEARVLEKYDPDRAAIVERFAREARDAVESNLSDWATLAEIEARTGWFRESLRTRARELEREGLARRTGRGWEVDREAAARIPVKQKSDPITPDELSDLDALARRLGRES